MLSISSSGIPDSPPISLSVRRKNDKKNEFKNTTNE